MNTQQQLEMFREPATGKPCVAWSVLEWNQKVYTPEEALQYIEQYEPNARNLRTIPCDVLYLENSTFFFVGFSQKDLNDHGFTIEDLEHDKN